MIKVVQILILLLFANVYGQNIDYNTKKGFVANGYDVVSYFNNKAVPGIFKYRTKYNDACFKFSTKKNLKLFKKNPEKYSPQYGGYCAYAVASGSKISINPKAFLVKNDKLFLFYKKYGLNTLKKWLKGDTDLKEKVANKAWEHIKFKN